MNLRRERENYRFTEEEVINGGLGQSSVLLICGVLVGPFWILLLSFI